MGCFGLLALGFSRVLLIGYKQGCKLLLFKVELSFGKACELLGPCASLLASSSFTSPFVYILLIGRNQCQSHCQPFKKHATQFFIPSIVLRFKNHFPSSPTMSLGDLGNCLGPHLGYGPLILTMHVIHSIMCQF